MNETVSVDDAISKGHKLVTYPGMIVLFGTINNIAPKSLFEDINDQPTLKQLYK